MALNNLEDRLECAIAHINTSVDIDPWAQSLAVESMRMRIALMKGGQPENIRCKDCKDFRRWIDTDITFCDLTEGRVCEDDFCSTIDGNRAYFCSYTCFMNHKKGKGKT